MLIFAIAVVPSSILFLWLLIIRPYCIRNGQGYTPGYTIGATMWVDWQFAKEIAKAKGNRGMRICCTIYLTLNIILFAPTVGAFFILIAGAFFG